MAQQDRRPGIVIATWGQESLKSVDGRQQIIKPFVAAEEPGQLAQLGIGIRFSETGSGLFKGTIVPRQLIQSWRGMRILEQLEVIEDNTLYLALQAGARKLHPTNQDAVDTLAGSVGAGKFRAFRNDILDQAPSVEELDKMLTALKENQVDIETWELKEEIDAGRMTSTPLAEEFIREGEKKYSSVKNPTMDSLTQRFLRAIRWN